MIAIAIFKKAEKDLLMLPIPSLAVGFLPRNASDEEYEQRAELIGYTGPLAIVKEKTVGCLRALMRILGAID
jgi:hypothetical protein